MHKPCDSQRWIIAARLFRKALSQDGLGADGIWARLAPSLPIQRLLRETLRQAAVRDDVNIVDPDLVRSEARYQLARSDPSTWLEHIGLPDPDLAQLMQQRWHCIGHAALAWAIEVSGDITLPLTSSPARRRSALAELEFRFQQLPIDERTVLQLALKGTTLRRIARRVGLSRMDTYSCWRRGLMWIRARISTNS